MDIQGLPQRKKRERSRGRKKKNTESDETKAEKPSSSNLFEDNVKVSESKDSKIDIPPEPEKKYECKRTLIEIVEILSKEGNMLADHGRLLPT
mmetsp:Transcript_38428/g.61680  ORF Transcript_38428/g.61680 Transcript_38428/m.61680 type:complete len:93 (-) Transcript_38428:521-799(-)